MPSALSRQRQRFQTCTSHAYSPHAIRCKLSCQPPRAACTQALQEIEPPARLHAICCCSRPNSRSLPMVRIAPKHWSCCNEPPSSFSHHLPVPLRSARIVHCGENVKVSGGDKEGSSSQGCLPEAIPRCVAACRRSPPDISLTLSVRRADLCRFTRRVTRMYLLCSFALRVSHRTLTGM